MASVDQIAEDIVNALLSMDGVDEASLVSYAIENLSERDKDKLIAQLKEDYDLISIDEAKEKYGCEE